MSKSRARLGLELLLSLHPEHELLSATWQYDGPWLLVSLGLRGQGEADAFAIYSYAILKATGAIYGVRDGAVGDDPLWVPAK